MTITCLHCGPVAVTDAATVAYVGRIVNALAMGHAPLQAITCPICHDEVRSRDVSDLPPLVSACAWCSDHAQRIADATMAGRVVTSGICSAHAAEFMERR
jgi:hypothetical protein